MSITNSHSLQPEARVTGIFPGPARFPSLPAHHEIGRSRVCEIVWLDAALFGSPLGTGAPGTPVGPVLLTILPEEALDLLSKAAGLPLKPGMLGEQITVRGLDPKAAKTGVHLRIGDAVLAITAPADFSPLIPLLHISAQVVGEIHGWTVDLLEEGLVEPGAPVTLIN
jgi:MOSC domain-containing protein YiiM